MFFPYCDWSINFGSTGAMFARQIGRAFDIDNSDYDGKGRMHINYLWHDSKSANLLRQQRKCYDKQFVKLDLFTGRPVCLYI